MPVSAWSKARKRICGRTEPRHAQLFVALHDLGLGFRLFITRTCVVWALRAGTRSLLIINDKRVDRSSQLGNTQTPAAGFLKICVCKKGDVS